jgi:hypothetical protein
MAKKTLAAMAEKLGSGDKSVEKDGQVKFICEYPNGYHFMVPQFDENGKPLIELDAQGNKRPRTFKQYDFTVVHAKKDKATGIVLSPAVTFFIADPELHGDDYKRIVEILTKTCKNPGNKMFLEEDHFKKRNFEAYNIAKKTSELEATIAEKDKEIAALQAKLGYNNTRP